MSGGGSGGGGNSSTVTQVQQIPEWQQGYAQQNEDIAAALAAKPYEAYQGQTIAGLTDLQNQGIDMTQQASNAYQPYLSSAQQTTQGVQNSSWNPQTAQQYMSPYAMAALAPQLQQLQLQQQQQAKNINAGATQAGAFGDARTGVQQSLNDFYGNLAQNDLVSQGMNQAYNTGMAAYQQNLQNQLAAGNQMAQLGSTAQNLGLTGANAVFNAGTQQQQLNQQMLTTAYNNFMNQQSYPYEQLNMRIAALANSPYTRTNYTSLAPTNATAQNLGAFASLAGAAGNLLGGGSGGGGIFGGA